MRHVLRVLELSFCASHRLALGRPGPQPAQCEELQPLHVKNSCSDCVPALLRRRSTGGCERVCG